MKIETKEHNGLTFVLAKYPVSAGDPGLLTAAAIWAPQTNIRPLRFSNKLTNITIDQAIEHFMKWAATVEYDKLSDTKPSDGTPGKWISATKPAHEA